MLLIRKRAEWQRAYANKQPLLISLLKKTFLTAKRVSKMVIITKALAGWWWGKKRAGQELKLKSSWDLPGRHRDPEKWDSVRVGTCVSFMEKTVFFPRSPGFPLLHLFFFLDFFYLCCPIIISNMFFQILFLFLLFFFPTRHCLHFPIYKYAFLVYWSWYPNMLNWSNSVF